METFGDLNAWLIEVNCLDHISLLATTLLSVFHAFILSVNILYPSLRSVLTKFPSDLAQFCSDIIDNVFAKVVLLLEFGALVVKEVRMSEYIIAFTRFMLCVGFTELH